MRRWRRKRARPEPTIGIYSIYNIFYIASADPNYNNPDPRLCKPVRILPRH